MKNIAIIIDGGYVRVRARKEGRKYTATLVEKLALAAKAADEEIHRILYYDCEEYSGTAKLPVSGSVTTFTPHSTLLGDLCKKQLFAVRKGVLKFRGFKPKSVPVASATLTDADFAPDSNRRV